MKKVGMIIAALAVAGVAYYFYEYMSHKAVDLKEGEAAVVAPQFDMVFESSTQTFKKDELNTDCSTKNAAVCAVEATVKCSINPALPICDKSKMPDFVFMQDESLGRPREISYQIISMKQIDKNTLEVHTQSTCDGQWFGLCSGKVIYVVDDAKGFFRVKDVYALAQ